MIEELFAALDLAFGQVRQQFPGEVRCGRGCADCCHAVFDVSLVEAHAMQRCLQGLSTAEREAVRQLAILALRQWQELAEQGGDLTRARIRCPLLDDQGGCRCYEVRPVNCRTYGIPTVIGGRGHVCGFSGFAPGLSYPTVNLEQVQRLLFDFSVRLAGQERGSRRWPLAAVALGIAELDGLEGGPEPL